MGQKWRYSLTICCRDNTMMKQSERKDRADLVETFKRFSQRYCQCNVLDAFLICLLTASLFCPPFVCVGPAVAVLVRFFCTKKIFQGALRLPGAVALMAFGLLMLLVTCVRGEEFNIIVALGIVALYIMPDFPAGDPITAAAIGAVSGFAATGIHQAAKQQKEDNSND